MHAIKRSICLVAMAMSLSALALNVTTDGPIARYYSGGRSILVITNTCNVTVAGSGTLELLAIGGGGGGGANHENLTYGGGGGGAGGVVHKVDLVVSPGTTRLVVGSGGGLSENGGDTSVFGITAFGGGAGASYLMRSKPGDGGSGGGATYNTGTTSPQSGGAAIYGGSDNVGNKGANSSHVYGAGGGGGAGAAAEDCTGRLRELAVKVCHSLSLEKRCGMPVVDQGIAMETTTQCREAAKAAVELADIKARTAKAAVVAAVPQADAVL